MRQSQSLIKALEAAAEVLTSESSNLKDLAAQASEISGIPANRILMNVDLTDIDLVDQDIDFLIDKGAVYHGAKLTTQQRQKFRKGERELRTRNMRMKIRSIRVNMISDFIEAFEQYDNTIISTDIDEWLDAQKLKAVLLSPIGKEYPSDKPLDERYTQRVLVRLAKFASTDSFDFFIDLFRLIGDLRCQFGELTNALLLDDYFQSFGESLGHLIGHLQPNSELDSKWIVSKNIDPPEFMQAKKTISERQIFIFERVTERARKINKYRPIHASAVEAGLDYINDPIQNIQFLETVDFDCSADQAERIALRIVNNSWSADRTREILEAKVPTKVRSALFRQILSQGETERILALLRWLDDNRGAVGALSLDDALTQIHNFHALFDFASDVHMNLAVNQIKVLQQALDRAAKGSEQRAKVRNLLSRKGKGS